MKLLLVIMALSLGVLHDAIGADGSQNNDDQALTSKLGFIHCGNLLFTRDKSGQMYFASVRRNRDCLLSFDSETGTLREQYKGRPLVCSEDGIAKLLEDGSCEANKQIKV